MIKKTLLLMMALFMTIIANAQKPEGVVKDGEDVYVTYNGLRFHRKVVHGGFSEWTQKGYLYVDFALALPENGQYSGDIVIPQNIPYHYEAQVYDIFNFAGYHHMECEIGTVREAEFSFEGNTDITSVTYPESFEVSSFKGCTNLKKIVLPTSPSQLYTDYYMPEEVFMGCKNLTEVRHIACLKYLEKSAFEGCEKLQKIDLTETYEDIFGEIKVASISSIGGSAFKDCKSLESIDLSNVTSIGSYAFQGCSELKESLESLNLSNVTSIGSYVFQGCSKLTEVKFEKSFIYNAEGLFSDCINLKTVSGFENMRNAQGSSSYRRIPAYTFRNCRSLVNISLPSTDDLRIEKSAFEGCESLKQIGGDFYISSTPYESAFKGCKSLETLPIDWKKGRSFPKEIFSGCHNLSFGDTLKAYSCRNSSFRECYKLKAMEIISDSYNVEDSAFYDCQNLTSFSVPSGFFGVFGDKVFYNCQNLYNFKCWLNRTGYQAFYNCKKLPSVVFTTTSGGMTIGEQAFKGCNDLDRITFYASSQPAGNEAFQECYQLKDIFLIAPALSNMEINSSTFPNTTFQDGVVHFAYDHILADEYMNAIYERGWKLFANKQFDYCNINLVNSDKKQNQLIYRQGTYYHVINGALVGWKDTECVIPKMVNDHYVTRIEPKAFKDNQWVTSIEIPASVQNIDSLAFSNTPSLKSIYVKNRFPIIFPYNEQRDPAYMSPFSGIDFEKCTLYVPAGTRDYYVQAKEWGKFKHIVESPDMGDTWSYPQYDYSGSTNTLHEIIDFVDPRTEDICVAHWDVNQSEKLCKLEAGIVSDLGKVFKGTDISSFCELQYFIKLTSIEESAFANCANLDSITIPRAVTTIGDWAFDGCNNLSKVFSQINFPKEFNDNVFTQNVYNSAILVVPVGTKAKYQSTAGWKNFVTIIEEGEDPDPLLPGDLNGDSEVDGMDLVALVNVIMGQSAQTGGADLNYDGEVDGMDYVAMVNIIMGTANSRSMDDVEHHINIGMEPLTIAPGERRELTITLQNADLPVTMAQMDMTLPEGLTLTGDYSLSSRTTERNHQLYISGNDGQHRLMLASPQNALLTGTEGAILRLMLQADDSFEGGDIVLSNMLCASPDLQSARQQQAVMHLGSTDGITDIMSTSQAVGKKVYTLSGQHLAVPHKGVNIIGGKKVIIK